MQVPTNKPGTPAELIVKYRSEEGQKFVIEFLEHSGVKGMRWGIRNEEKGPGLDPVITTYATVFAAAQVFRLIDSGKLHTLSNKPLRVDPKLSRKNMSVDTLHKTVVKPINPDFGKAGTKMNCRRCTFAYELRRRGLDVKATRTLAATGQGSKGLVKAVKSKSKDSISPHIKRNSWGENSIGDKGFYKKNGKEKSDEIFKALNKMPNRSRGELCVGWIFGGGHSLAWERINKKAVVFDTQSGKIWDEKTMQEHAKIMAEASYTRLDNVDLNMGFLGRWVQNAN